MGDKTTEVPKDATSDTPLLVKNNPTNVEKNDDAAANEAKAAASAAADVMKNLLCTGFRACKSWIGATKVTMNLLGIIGLFCMFFAAFIDIFKHFTNGFCLFNRICILVITLPIISIEGTTYNYLCADFLLEYASRLRRFTLKWLRCATKLWGRALFYLLLGTLGLSQWTVLVGIFSIILFGIGLTYIILAVVTWKKMEKMKKNFFDENNQEQFEEMFERFDVNKDGFIDKEELISMTEELGSKLSEFEAEMIFDKLDYSADGRIELNEFKLWWMSSKFFDGWGDDADLSTINGNNNDDLTAA